MSLNECGLKFIRRCQFREAWSALISLCFDSLACVLVQTTLRRKDTQSNVMSGQSILIPLIGVTIVNTWTFNPQRTLNEPLSSRAASAALPPFCPLRFVDGTPAVIPSRRPSPILHIASVRALPVIWSHPYGSSRWTVTLIVTRRYFKDKFPASFLDSCFVFPDSKFLSCSQPEIVLFLLPIE